MLNVVLLIAGFAPLIYGAHLLVEAASSIAMKLNVPSIVIGLTIVAFGTSAPELVVNVLGALENNSSIVIGNVIGSNILNILLILGLSAAILPISVQKNTTWLEIPLAVLSAVAVFLIADDILLDGSSARIISRAEGFLLLLFFFIFLVYNFQLAKSGHEESEIPDKEYPNWLDSLLIPAGILFLVLGGWMIVTFATKMAKEMGISDRIIAVTIVSLGTSLPELATSVVAAIRRKADIAIGNVVGSNIFNAFFILGISATITPVDVSAGSLVDIIVNIISSILLFAVLFVGKGRIISSAEGIGFVLLYLVYLTWLILVG